MNCRRYLAAALMTLLIGIGPALSQTPSPAAARTPAASVASPAVAQGPFVCSSADKGSPFHKSTCTYAKKISAKNLQSFQTREEALKAGHQPCKVCKP